MKRQISQSSDSARTAGPRLRCFLEFCCSTLLPILIVVSPLEMAATAASAQVTAPAPYHLARLRGVFVDEKGNPIPGAAVTLDQDDKVRYSTKTDRTGAFEIKHVTGHYRLRVNMEGYSPLSREVIVGVEALTYLHSDTLYVIAGPGGCSDDCSTVLTSKGKFEQAIRRNTGHQD
jgi:hypothetical protein